MNLINGNSVARMGRLLPNSFFWQENQQYLVNNFLVLRLNAQKHEPECSSVLLPKYYNFSLNDAYTNVNDSFQEGARV